MTTPTELLRHALEALEQHCGDRCNREYNPCEDRELAEAIRAHLASGDVQEPQPSKYGSPEFQELILAKLTTKQEPAVPPGYVHARQAVAFEIALATLEQISSTPRNKNAKQNAKATLGFIKTQLDAAMIAAAPTPKEPK